jgi:hypothetical protein
LADSPASEPASPTVAPSAAPRQPSAHVQRHAVPVGLVVLAGGVVLPDRRLTPGAIYPRVSQSDIHSTICVSGYTATERPASSYTTSLKVRQLAAGYAFHGDQRTADYEEDHLISLELGGSPTSPKNLWPEPYAAHEGARVKDRIENKLHELVCDGALALRAAQHAIATNWWSAYQRYVPVAAPRPTVSAHRTTAPPLAASPVHHGCTTTSSGTCIRGGEFCPRADYGTTGYDASGTALVCTGNGTHPHWK